MTRTRRRWCFPAQRLLEQFEPGCTARTIADRLGIHRLKVQRWRDHDTNFDPYTADRYAIRLGKHPSAIWDDWFQLPEYTPKQLKRIMKGIPCPLTNATTAETKSSQPNTAAGATTSPRSTSTSSSSNTTKPKRKR